MSVVTQESLKVEVRGGGGRICHNGVTIKRCAAALYVT